VQAPKINLGNDTVLCEVAGFGITANPPNLQYLWSTNAITRSIQINLPGKYWVRVSDKGCYAYDTMQIFINKLPKPRLGKDTLICLGDTLMLKGLTSGAKTYSWNTGNKKPDQKVFVTGSYIMDVSDSLCNTSDTILVQVIPYPKINLGKDTGFCGNFSLMLDALHAGLKKVWNTGDTTQKINANKHSAYWVQINDRGCISKDTIMINKLTGPFINLGKDSVYCHPVNRTLNAGNPGMNYLWNDGSTASNLTVNADGKYWVRITDYASCVYSDTIILTDASFRFNLGKDTALCFGQVLHLMAKDSSYTHLWNMGKNTASLTVSQSGKYSVTVSKGACTYSDSIRVSILPKSAVDLGPDTEICELKDESTTLNGPVGYPYYLWMPGGEVTPDILVKKSGTYRLQITDINTCIASDTLSVLNLCPISLWVPTAFSPGSGSGSPNATFGVSYLGPPVESFEMRIFNRWGEMVYRTGSVTDYWDGIYMNAPCQMGMYMCILHLTAQYGNEVKRKTYEGMFLLLR